MDWTKIITKVGGIAMVVFAEVKDDMADGKLTVDELIDNTKTVVDKLGYGGKTIINFSQKK